jgi:hypothetical protein
VVEISSKLHNKWDRPREAAKAFDELGISYTTYSNGLHWKFTIEGIEYNYFPTTGRWYTIEPKHYCTGGQRFLGGLLRTLNIPFKEL